MMDDSKIKGIVWLNKSESKLKQVSSLSIPNSLCVQACMFKLVHSLKSVQTLRDVAVYTRVVRMGR